jgi:beta-phosphoglucomutase-like phosphatase (HAD superfamily)
VTSLDAVVFDLDGTLIDTEQTWDDIRRSLADEAGRPWPAEATRAMMGMSTPEWSAYLHDVVGVGTSPADAARLTIDAMAEHHRRGVATLTGAVESVRRMAALGLPRGLGVASSSPRVLIDAALSALGVADLVRASVSTEEVAAGKPAPDGYLRVAELLGADPTRCVAVEDATNGILSALAAGMRVVAVPPHFHPPPADVLERADAVIDSLDGLDAALLKRVAG